MNRIFARPAGQVEGRVRHIGLSGMILLAATLAAWLPMAGPALAAGQETADHPPLTPQRDAAITYRFEPRPTEQDLRESGQPRQPVQARYVQVLYAGDGGLLRINYLTGDADSAPRGAVIINRAAQEVLVVLDAGRVYTRLTERESVRNPFLLDLSMQFTRAGTSSVAGQPCTLWQAYSAQGGARACVTDEGLILSQEGVDVDGLNGSLQAVRVSYAPVPSSAFQPPAGFQEVQARHEGGADGSGRGPLSGAPASSEHNSAGDHP
ncbi:MAG: hypothetical protein ABF593_10025 [Acetobacter papayae]|uniref:hypothetical protein n=1 Tax=Acetobacter papayae TaxID=1076592 RepID=UPI0039E75380